MKYAKNTNVSAGRTEIEIKRTLTKYGADDVISGQSAREGCAFVEFFYKDMRIRIIVPIPDKDDPKYKKTEMGYQRTNEKTILEEWQKECRQAWRVLLLLIKANLEAVDAKFMDAREIFMPWILLPNNQTVAQRLLPELKNVISTGNMPKLLTINK